MDCSPPGASVHETLPLRRVEWVLSHSGIQPLPHLLGLLHWQTGRLILYQGAAWEAPVKEGVPYIGVVGGEAGQSWSPVTTIKQLLQEDSREA